MSETSARLMPAAIVKAAYGDEAVQEAFEILAALRSTGVELLLFTDRKFDGRKLVTVRNIEADYPVDMVALRNMALLAKASGATCDYYRDGYEMLCLVRAMDKGMRGRCLLLRDRGAPTAADLDWLQRKDAEPFRIAGADGNRDSFLFDCSQELTRRAIALTVDFYRSGSLLSLSVPSLSHALRVALGSISASLPLSILVETA